MLCQLCFQAHEKRQVVVAEFLDQEGRDLQGGLQPGCVDGPAAADAAVDGDAGAGL